MRPPPPPPLKISFPQPCDKKVIVSIEQNSPVVLVHVAVGAGLPSTLQTIEIVSFSLTEKSEVGTVPMI